MRLSARLSARSSRRNPAAPSSAAAAACAAASSAAVNQTRARGVARLDDRDLDAREPRVADLAPQQEIQLFADQLLQAHRARAVADRPLSSLFPRFSRFAHDTRTPFTPGGRVAPPGAPMIEGWIEGRGRAQARARRWRAGGRGSETSRPVAAAAFTLARGVPQSVRGPTLLRARRGDDSIAVLGCRHAGHLPFSDALNGLVFKRASKINDRTNRNSRASLAGFVALLGRPASSTCFVDVLRRRASSTRLVDPLRRRASSTCFVERPRRYTA